jgi:hypothetical protein
MRTLLLALALCLLCSTAHAVVAFEQPPSPAGGVVLSSWCFPNGLDGDTYAYDSFIIPTTTPITEVRWRGGYLYTGWGIVNNFSITFYESIAGGSQPHVGLPGDGDPYLVTWVSGDICGETLAGVFGGTTMYDYHFTLPQPFQAQAGVKYWVRIEGYTNSWSYWGLCVGTGGDNLHFQYVTGGNFSFGQHDTAFSLHTTAGPSYSITTSAAPAGTGTTSGDGSYPAGSTTTVVATPNAGYGFVNWTENGAQVSTNASYTFTVNANRNLVAHFTTAYTITTSAQPALGGTTTGGGLYNAGTSVTVAATPNGTWQFVNWTEGGTQVSTTASYTFVASANRTLVANFSLGSAGVLFDFDNAPIHTSLPIDLTVGGLTAHLSATGQGFSIQPANTMGFTPVGFGGLCIYPNSVFPADLLVSFSQSLTAFTIMFSPQELGCDDTATMRVTAYLNGAYVGTNTAMASPPGTWPSGTLSFSSAAPFNSVVVHYDQRPPTCADWGPIFLADNMTATVVSGPSSVTPVSPETMTPVILPNPFGAETTVRFSLARSGPVSVSVYDLQGRLVRTLAGGGLLEAGVRELRWDGRDADGREVANGVYLCRVEADGQAASRRMVVLRPR